MSIWDDLSPEERIVLNNALEEAWLTNVIGDFLGHTEHGGAVWMESTDAEAIRPLIPRFEAVVKDMIRRDLIELVPTDRYDDWPDHQPMTDDEIDAAVAEPTTWLPSPTGPIMLMTTDRADRLLGRQPTSKEPKYSKDTRPRRVDPET